MTVIQHLFPKLFGRPVGAQRLAVPGGGRKRLGRYLQMGLVACFLLVGAPTVVDGATKAAPTAAEILARAERIRLPSNAFQARITIVTLRPETKPEVRVYRVLSKGNDKTLVETLKPAIDRGQILLMRGHDLWAFLPNLSQPVRLPLSQRLTGEVANGDLARANFVGDYRPHLLRREKIDGKSYYVLQLDAVDRWVTYHKVLYWVDVRSFRPFKAEFYTVSGRLLKTAYYRKFKNMAGESRPSRMVIVDALKKGHQSVLQYSEMRLRKLSDRIFNKDYLKKISR